MRTVLERLRQHARERPEDAAYRERTGDGWRAVGWRAYDEQVRRVAKALVALGVETQETVGLLGVNRPAWAVGCLGAQAARAVPVGIYQTCSAEQVAYIASHAEMRVIVVDSVDQWRKITAHRAELPRLVAVVAMPEIAADEVEGAAAGDRLFLSWRDFLARGDGADETEVEARFEAISRDDLGSLIYTSGTTGRPKAVMLSHGNLVETCRIGAVLHDLHPTDSLISYLPLAHIAEQMLSVHMPTYIGYSASYVDAPEDLLDALQALEPTVFFGVPRVWEKIHAGIAEKLRAAPSSRRRLASWVLKVGRARCDALDRGRPPSLGVRLQWALADRRVASKVRARLGLGRVRIAASGAAPLGRDVIDFFAGFGVRILEVYGLSECCGPGTWNRHDLCRAGTVGPPIPEVEVRLVGETAEAGGEAGGSGEGEVLLRGPNIFQGYCKDPEATAEALDADGWLHTGDLGRLDEAGCLTITGRKKDLLITSGGKNIAPSGIEAKLKQIELVGDALVLGDRRRFIAALLTLDEDALAGFAAQHGLDASDPATLARNPRVDEAVQRSVDQVNETLARVESVRAFRILPRRFSVDEGELTPTLKPKRRVIEEHWAREIEDLYRPR
ncbi:MAG: long-chain fatty acid--CoA ligase [Acidobacteriota bacterium]